ncbi:3-oxoacyl-[acyl-carrier-protein] synthase II [Microvirga flocculans]|uniref:3-oxoacyl-[acyl-carrier-protein] synthase II n=1 Tax=Microvirga flocculans TaxID=217168 RepID=A0A7W6N9C0_9HYPH|nr:beta-ketoacyl-ACP synthase [Microvirga flocculans]MBB4041313.1 3-oxoacyl-[acyl-carrier-protein] synthase II [Microvirga flocculans]
MRDVVITGVGLVSCAGEGLETHLAALAAAGAPNTDTASFEPFQVHPVVPLEWDRQIPKKADQRQMEAWQKLGCYAAGLALDAAGAKEDAALKSRMQLIVAAGGGERDYAVDGQILTGLRTAENPGVFLNERLMSDLRPTLFLAQLSNLLAGNISIVHGVTGASRTFMGEESSGVDALRIARERIASGQDDIFLVGGAYNAERPDVLLIYEMGGFHWKKPYRSVWERPAEGGGMILGSGACFLVLESREHAASRGAKPLASLAGIASDRSRRQPGSVEKALHGLAQQLRARPEAVISGATGVQGITEEERAALKDIAPEAAVHATADLIGHTIEAQAPAGVALAAGLIAQGKAAEALVTSVGHWRGEGAIRLTKA